MFPATETVHLLPSARINLTMKKIFFLGLTFLWSATAVLSQDKPEERTQDRTADRAQLHELLQERQKKFGSYTASLKKRSGIFGGKTKVDLQRSNKVLMDIIDTDNRMISVLNRVVDFKTYEKVNMNYELLSCNERVENLQRAVDALNTHVSKLTSSNTALEKRTGNLKFLTTTFGILVLGLLIFIAVRRFNST